MKSRMVSLAIVGAVCTALVSPTPASASAAAGYGGRFDIDYRITSPYDAVDWRWAQYKAGFHNHTTESDGGNTATQMLEQAYELGFNIYALTDHNVTSDGAGFDRKVPFKEANRSIPNYYLTTERALEMNRGVGRDGAGMIGVPHSNEQSISDHLNTFWINWNNTEMPAPVTLEKKIEHVDAATGALDPIMHLNHPGRYYGGSNSKPGPNGEDLGAMAANDPLKVARYVSLFRAYPKTVIGMEIVNKVGDGDSYSDRIMWDNILAQTMPDLNVAGFCNDDAHSTGALGYDYNMMLMPELSEKATYRAMTSGAWYCSALVAKRELGATFKGDRTKPAPTIQRITTDQRADSITIQAKDYTRIEWIADGKVIASGETLDLDTVSKHVDNYVRAQLIGDNGITFTNAFAVQLNVKDSHGRYLSKSGAAAAALASLDRTTAPHVVIPMFWGRTKSYLVVVTIADRTQVVRVHAITGEIL